MSVIVNRKIHPEITLADYLLGCIPRTDRISRANLLAVLYGNPKYYPEYRDYFEFALELLKRENYIEVIDGTGENTGTKEYCLTIEGRKLQAEGGYLKKYKEKIDKEQFDKKVSTAEGRKKIFDNKVKYIAFSALILTAMLGLWTKLSSSNKKNETAIRNVAKDDTNILKPQEQQGLETTLTPENKNPQGAVPEEAKNENSPAPLKSGSSIQIITSDHIEFKLLSVIGIAKTQSVTFTMILTTSAANWYINSRVKSIIDTEGNEYRLKSFTIGASDYISTVDLITDVPIKCTYTFGGVLSDVKTIKLFKYDYSHSAGEPFAAEFRDIPVDWK